MPKKNGFTLIELMVVVAIIGVLSVIGIAIYANAQKGVRDARRKSDVEAIASAYEQNYDPIKNKYQVLAQTDFQNGKFPVPPESPTGYYDGFNSNDFFVAATGKAPSWRVCARLEGQSSACTQSSATCYCRSSTQGKTEIANISAGWSVLLPAPGGGTIPVSPIPTNGLVLWLRTDDINIADATQVSAGSVIKWVSSPYCCSKDAVKKGTYNTPSLVTNQINGRSVVRFSTQVLEVANLTGKSNFSLFFVGRYSDGFPLSWGNPPFAPGIDKGGFYSFSSVLGEYLNGTFSSTSGGTQNWTVYNSHTVIKSNSFSCYQGLNSTNCGTSGNIGQGNITGDFVIGGLKWSTDPLIVNYFGTGDFAEIIFYDRPLAGSAALDSERNQVINYLKAKYGFQS